MNSRKQGDFGWRWTWGLLLVGLGVLFYQSLLPGRVLFSNDAQFGMLSSRPAQLPGTFLGFWQYLQWVGFETVGASPNLSQIFGTLLSGAVGISKLYAPASLLFLGISAAVFIRSTGMRGYVMGLTALAAALNSNPVSYACWGLPPKAMALAFALLAMAAIHQRASGWRLWGWTALSGFAVGLCVMEGADMGAMLSVLVGLYAAVEFLAQGVHRPGTWLSAAARLAVIVGCAGWMAIHTVVTLVDTSIIGVSGMSQGAESRAQRWAFATSWSFPPIETLRLAIPGIFGYRMDTPGEGAYWGRVGPDGSAQNRFSGDGEYAGALVLLVASLAVLSAAKVSKGPYRPEERRRVWFFAAVAVSTLLFSYGRFAPFYEAVFSLPYFSTIRGPSKFLHLTHLSLLVLFGYGLEALIRLRVTEAALADGRDAWRHLSESARHWLIFAATVCAVAALGAVVFTTRGPDLDSYLETVFVKPAPKLASAGFAIREAWLGVLFFTIAAGAAAWVILRPLREKSWDWPWIVLAGVLVLDLSRANLPWVRYYDYRTRYQSNVVIDLLKDHPWEHRVTAFINPTRSGLFVSIQSFALLQHEWLENHFPYYDIQSLDIDQMPRMPELESAYLGAFAPGDRRQPEALEQAERILLSVPYLARLPADERGKIAALLPSVRDQMFPIRRMWELTNTRYVMGWHDGFKWYNDILDPVGRRFSLKLSYAVAAKPGLPPPSKDIAESEAVQSVTAVQSDNGPLAILEFSGALPRARLYHRWEILDGTEALERLRARDFEPTAAVVLATNPAITPSDVPPGSASITRYDPRRVVVETVDSQPSVLLLNDRWTARWKASVDGNPAPIIRANFLMRGVALPQGKHTVEFTYSPPLTTLFASSSGLLAACILYFSVRRRPSSESPKVGLG